jgi:antitoxin component YwqK of YwqJK toxin-antitoxin module
MNIYESLRSLILENVLLQQLKDKYVGEGKPVSQELFEEIEKVCKNKFYLVQWLTKKVGTFVIKDEDVYKYEEYFEIFEKNKSKFPFTDINQVKTSNEVQDFIRKCIEIREEGIRFEDQPLGNNYLTQNEIEKLESGGGSKYLGMFDNYQVFQISSPDERNWKVYRDLLGRCKGREQGAKIEICTIGDYDYFKRYLTNPRGSSYFVLYNLDDPKSPYQLHVESGQFMDKDDDSDIKIRKLAFYNWLADKSEKYTKKYIFNKLKRQSVLLPVEGKGYEDEKGMQGTWVRGGYYKEKENYKDDKQNGWQYSYYHGGRINNKTMYVDGKRNGPHFEWQPDGVLDTKGNYKDDEAIGVWYYIDHYNPRRRYVDDVEYKLVDYDNNVTTYHRKDDTIDSKYIGDVDRKASMEIYYPNGALKAKGKKTQQGNSGIWYFYDPSGKLIGEGKFSRGKRVGVFKFYFTEMVNTKQGKKKMNLVYNIDFENRIVQIFTDTGKQVTRPFNFFDDKAEKYLEKIGYWGKKQDITEP